MRARHGAKGQSTVEYLLTTMMLVTFFVGLYGFLHAQTKRLFVAGGTQILIMRDKIQ